MIISVRDVFTFQMCHGIMEMALPVRNRHVLEMLGKSFPVKEGFYILDSREAIYRTYSNIGYPRVWPFRTTMGQDTHPAVSYSQRGPMNMPAGMARFKVDVVEEVTEEEATHITSCNLSSIGVPGSSYLYNDIDRVEPWAHERHYLRKKYSENSSFVKVCVTIIDQSKVITDKPHLYRFMNYQPHVAEEVVGFQLGAFR